METPMYTPEDRAKLRAELLERASRDEYITGVAITGSAAMDREDRWSDIDLAFGVGADLPGVLADWTTQMYQRHSAVHHTDVRFEAWIYRVFLLANTLQVDLAFVPASRFQALSPAFRLMHGKANEALEVPPSSLDAIIGMAWLHALHARSSIARGRRWQAEYMIIEIRDNALALACLRLGLPTVHGRGMDQLPAAVAGKFEDA